jgi:sec-independent protein translocase protein TatB
MDSIFNIGGPELLMILLLAGIVMGPKRIQVVAHWLGRMTAQLQAISRGFARQLNAELAAVDEGGELKGSFDEIQELRRQLNDLKKEITSVAMSSVGEIKSTVDGTREMVNHSIMPPNFGANTKKKDEGEKKEKSEDGDDTDIILPSPPLTLPSIIDIADDPD